MEQRPIVIKRIKKAAHAHHGGSWKVAYADFVTAMMAFFLLMWLMGFTTEGERKAISDYFQSPSAIQGKGGSSTSPIDMGKGMDAPRTSQKKLNQDTLSVMDEDVPTESRGSAAALSDDAKKAMTEADKKRLESLLDELKQAIDASQALKPFKDQLLLDITSEGMRIQIIDKENRPMFDVGSSNLQPYTKGILREIAKVIAMVPNHISIAGHTDARPYVSISDYSNWELSSERANACRRELVRGGVGEEKMARVVGLASTALFNKADPYSPINRRISIVVLNKETEDAMMEKEAADSAGASMSPLSTESSAAASRDIEIPDAAPPVLPKVSEPAPTAKPEPVAAPTSTPTPAAALRTAPASATKAVVPTAPSSKPAASAPSPAKASAASPSTTPPPARVGPSAVQLPGLPITTPPIGVIPSAPAASESKPKK